VDDPDSLDDRYGLVLELGRGDGVLSVRWSKRLSACRSWLWACWKIGPPSQTIAH
jgi:hypothetical protein